MLWIITQIKILENISISNASINRNIGSEKTKSDFLLFVDKDVILDSSYINDNFIKAFIDDKGKYKCYQASQKGCKETKSRDIDINDISNILPHKYPFQLLNLFHLRYCILPSVLVNV